MKVLYFVKGGVPSEKQRAEARAMGALIRNANISSGDFVERCDAVAGEVPKAYAGFPREVHGKAIDDQSAGVDSDGDAVAGEGKSLAEMSNRELDAEAERLGIKFPAVVNTKAEKAEYIQAHLDAK